MPEEQEWEIENVELIDNSDLIGTIMEVVMNEITVEGEEGNQRVVLNKDQARANLATVLNLPEFTP